MTGLAVEWRTVSHQLSEDDELLRFRVVDMNAVINKAVGDADLYRDVLRHLGREPTPVGTCPLHVCADWPARPGGGDPGDARSRLPDRPCRPTPAGRRRGLAHARRELRSLFDKVLELFDGPFKADGSETDRGT